MMCGNYQMLGSVFVFFLLLNIDKMSAEEISTHKVDLHGRYSWELVWKIDNNENPTVMREQISFKTSVTCSYHDLRKEVENRSEAVHTGQDFDIIKIVVKGDITPEVKSMFENMSEKHDDCKTETKKTETFDVGPHSQMKIYRLVFQGPGMTYFTDTLSSEPDFVEDTPVELTINVHDKISEQSE